MPHVGFPGTLITSEQRPPAVSVHRVTWVEDREGPLPHPAQDKDSTGLGMTRPAADGLYADNSKTLPLWKELPSLAYWIFPAAIGIPLIVRALLRHPFARHRPNSSRVAYGITQRARSRGSSLQRISNDCFPSRATELPVAPGSTPTRSRPPQRSRS
jgi:hypothetical protein